MKTCKECGSQNEDGLIHCIKCGGVVFDSAEQKYPRPPLPTQRHVMPPLPQATLGLNKDSSIINVAGMKIRIALILLCVTAAFLLTGWLMSNSDYQELRVKAAGIEEANAALTQSNIELGAENGTMSQNISNYANYLEINDYLYQNREKLIQGFQEDYSTNKEAIFEAAGGKGQILDFQVRDVFFYNRAVVVSMQFLWSNDDSSGGSESVYLSLDPDNDYALTNFAVSAQTLISAQELATLTSQSASNQVAQLQAQQIEQNTTPEIQATTQSPSAFHMSDETKNALIQDGAAIVTSIIEAAAVITGQGSGTDNQ